MSGIFRFFLLIVVIILGMSILVAQKKSRDVVYLKNGDIIKGMIIEMIPDKTIKIETSDGDVFTYNMSEVEKITKETVPSAQPTPPVYEVPESRSVSPPFSFSVFGGGAIPTGEFTEDGIGKASTGFMLGIQCVGSGTISWIVSGSYSNNKSGYDGPLFTLETTNKEYGSWSSIHLLGGIKLGTANPTGVNFYFAPLIGMLYSMTPEMKADINDIYFFNSGYPYYNYYYIPVTGSGTWESVSSTVLAYGAAAEVTIDNRFVLGARYITGKPKYELKGECSFSGSTSSASVSGTETITGKHEKNKPLVLLYLGVAF